MTSYNGVFRTLVFVYDNCTIFTTLSDMNYYMDVSCSVFIVVGCGYYVCALIDERLCKTGGIQGKK